MLLWLHTEVCRSWEGHIQGQATEVPPGLEPKPSSQQLCLCTSPNLHTQRELKITSGLGQSPQRSNSGSPQLVTAEMSPQAPSKEDFPDGGGTGRARDSSKGEEAGTKA